MRSLTNEEMSVIAGGDFNGLFDNEFPQPGRDPLEGWDAGETRPPGSNSWGEPAPDEARNGEYQRFDAACQGDVACKEVVYKRYYG